MSIRLLARSVAAAAIIASAFAARSPVTWASSAKPVQISQAGLPDGLVREVFLADLDFPVSMAWTPDGGLFFTEKFTGKVRYFDGRRLAEEPFVTLPVNAEVERGLLGMTLDPAYVDNGYVYVFYTQADPLANRIVRLTDQDGRGVGPRVLLDAPITTEFSIHNGGNMAFGPDGMLYVTLGENNNPFWARDLSQPYGKVLRIDPADGSAPEDNPFYDDGNPLTGRDDRIFAYGLRNPFDLTFRPGSNELYVSENGPECDDEIDLVVAGGDYGWGPDYPCPDGLGLGLPPVASFTPVITPTGMAFYSGDAIPGLAGDLLVCSWNLRELLRMRLPGGDPAEGPEAPAVESWGPGCGSDVTVGPDGYLYLASSGWGPKEGTIRRIRPGRVQADWDIANGHYFSQRAEGDAEGYAVTDDSEVRFWSEYRRLGGTEYLGYPISHRFFRGGFWYQAFERVLLKWNPNVSMVEFINVMDELHIWNYDDRLLKDYGVPAHVGGPANAFDSFDQAVESHLHILDAAPALKRRFLSNPNWLQLYGLPVALTNSGQVTAVRAQRAVLYLRSGPDGPGPTAYELTVVSGSELAREVEFIPGYAVSPRS